MVAPFRSSLPTYLTVVARSSGSDDESGLVDSEVGTGGQSRTIYSHRHLSPHRMMHFGKRLLVSQAPALYIGGQTLDPYRRRPTGAQQQEQQDQQPPAPLPYTLYFPMTRDRVLEADQPGEYRLGAPIDGR
jgi:hypothetical protein